LYLFFKQVADGIRQFEVEPVEDNSQVFKNGDAVQVQERLLAGFKRALDCGRFDLSA
jgi:hypothetical protein